MSASRKDDHVRLAMEQNAGVRRSRDFDDVRFVHHPLAAVDVAEVDLSVDILGSTWAMPFYINGMTGGSEFTGSINRALAIAAAETGIALASGSMSAYFRDPSSAPSFTVLREENPHGFLLANLSANATPEQAQEAVDLIDAQALQIHVNPVQELVMPEGDRAFAAWAENIGRIAATLSVPVVVKEVGFGMSAETVQILADLGVSVVDVAGNGGTNFAVIENSRREDDFSLLNTWGQSAVVSVLDCADTARQHDLPLFASGGVRSPMDVLVSLALGARAVGVAGGFLSVIRNEGPEALIARIETWRDQLTSMLALVGARTPADLLHTDLIITGHVRDYAQARGIDTTALSSRRRTHLQGGSRD